MNGKTNKLHIQELHDLHIRLNCVTVVIWNKIAVAEFGGKKRNTEFWCGDGLKRGSLDDTEGGSIT
jgi:hypothetical protein